jgi:hypothetical protein
MQDSSILCTVEMQAGVAQSQPRKRRCFQADRPTILNSKTYDRADDLNIHILSSPTFLSLADNWA